MTVFGEKIRAIHEGYIEVTNIIGELVELSDKEEATEKEFEALMSKYIERNMKLYSLLGKLDR